MKQRFLLFLFLIILLSAGTSIVLSEFAVRKNVERMILERARDRLAAIVWSYGAMSTDVDVYSYINYERELLTVRKDRVIIFQYGTARLDLDAPTTRTLSDRTGAYEFTLNLDFDAATEEYFHLVWTAARISAGIFSLFFAVFGWIFIRALVDPVSRLAATMVEITSRNLRIRVPLPRRRDEMYRLIKTFNSMLDEIADSYERRIRFVEDTAHDIATPVQILEGYRQLIERHGRTETLVDEYLRVSKVELLRLREMAVSLKDLRAAERRRSAEPVDATRITEGIVGNYRELFPDLRFEVRLDAAVFLKIDEVDLERIENILLDNAVKYGGSGGRVEIELDTGRFTVRDFGGGMSGEDAEKAFDRYHRGARALSHCSGSGLGLAILKTFAEEYGFRIEMDNRPGEGCSFSLRFDEITSED
jgi:signal transduction histidine kinase